MTEVRKQSCTACPYRRDVPSGVWAETEYDKLTEYDRPTAEQPMAPFACHATPETYCHGWAVVHSNRGGPYELLALRIATFTDLRNGLGGRLRPLLPEPDEGLFGSGAEAAEHGKRDIANPSSQARDTVARLQRKYERLQ